MKEASQSAAASENGPSPVDTLRGSTYRLPQARAIASSDLLCGRRVVLIEHHGAVYQLRATSQGKLILTK